MSKQEDEKFLELYSDSIYEKPSTTIDAVILKLVDKENSNYRKLAEKKLQVFLTKRQYSPFKDYYSIVGTFVDLNHELNQSMQLCVKNKVALTNFYSEQLYTFGEKSRDPRTRVLSISYLLLTNNDSDLKNGEWFDIQINEKTVSSNKDANGFSVKKEINIVLSNNSTTINNKLLVDFQKNQLTETKTVSILNTDIAFDHIKIIYYAIERLKNKLEYTDIIFNLLPNEFTLTELKNSYEAILDKKLLDANFRRKTAKLVEPTSNFVTGKGHRSSQLFTHNPLWKLITLD